MKLLNARTYEITDVHAVWRKPYAILSHTWGDEEVSFQEVSTDLEKAKLKRGFRKIEYCCAQAVKKGLSWVWIDTCCIDKTSSAELSEAINAMYSYYENSVVCYVYLEDVPDSASQEGLASEQLKQSRWFTRGWTLQELIAPRHVSFWTHGWEYLDDKRNAVKTLSQYTGIEDRVLRERSYAAECSIAQRMSRMSHRQTTRIEDRAYCLMGIFGVNMPLLYGEGRKAFLRLQEEIIKESNDESVFAWIGRSGLPSYGLLASSPDFFARSSLCRPLREGTSRRPFGKTNRGLHLTLPVFNRKDEELGFILSIGVLHCTSNTGEDFAGIGLIQHGAEDEYYRAPWGATSCLPVSLNEYRRSVPLTFYVQSTVPTMGSRKNLYPYHLGRLRHLSYRNERTRDPLKIHEIINYAPAVDFEMQSTETFGFTLANVQSPAPLFCISQIRSKLSLAVVMVRGDGATFAVLIGSLRTVSRTIASLCIVENWEVDSSWALAEQLFERSLHREFGESESRFETSVEKVSVSCSYEVEGDLKKVLVIDLNVWPKIKVSQSQSQTVE